MRLRARDSRTESFSAHRNANGTYAGSGAAFRPLLFDTMQSDRTDGKIAFVPESRFVFTAKEVEVWHFTLMVGLSTALATGELIEAVLQHSIYGTLQGGSYIANAASNNYFPRASVTLPFSPGDTLQPQLYSGAASGNNPHSLCEFSGVRVG